MNRLQTWFYTLTGGRPMTPMVHAAFDDVNNEPVGYWRDKFGRLWLCNMDSPIPGWQLSRTEASPDVQYDSKE